MLEGWYCRSLANQKATTGNIEQESDDELQTKPSAAVSGQVPGASSSASTGPANVNVDYKERYRNLKRKLKFLIYENEYFQDLLHTNQRRLLKVSRDRSFLIDRLLLYEKPAKDSSDSDATDSSNSDAEPTTSTSTGMQLPNTLDATKEAAAMRKKHKEKIDAKMTGPPIQQLVVSGATRGRKRKVLPGGGGGIVHQQLSKKPLITTATVSPSLQHQHQVGASNTLSTAEITRQLQERRPTPIELMSPECASATVPATMLSDESPSKLYPNESLQHLMEDDSPSHVAAEECVPMVYTT